jgi:carbon-monoxide dehydrogenase medium subunit
LRAFDYAAPKSLKEAVALLSQKGDRARVLSGGTDLIVQVREKRRDLDLMVDVKKIPELLEIRYDATAGLTLGASVPCNRIYEHPVVSRTYPGLVDAAFLIGGTQIQNRASLGGNLCNASPAADSIPALIAHLRGLRDCRIEGRTRTALSKSSASHRDGMRSNPANCWCPFAFRLRRRVSGRTICGFIPRNEMDIAVVGCGASLSLENDLKTVASARVSLGAGCSNTFAG